MHHNCWKQKRGSGISIRALQRHTFFFTLFNLGFPLIPAWINELHFLFSSLSSQLLFLFSDCCFSFFFSKSQVLMGNYYISCIFCPSVLLKNIKKKEENKSKLTTYFVESDFKGISTALLPPHPHLQCPSIHPFSTTWISSPWDEWKPLFKGKQHPNLHWVLTFLSQLCTYSSHTSQQAHFQNRNFGHLSLASH